MHRILILYHHFVQWPIDHVQPQRTIMLLLEQHRHAKNSLERLNKASIK